MADDSPGMRDDGPVSRDEKLEELYDLIDGIEIALMTTRRSDGHLVSRPMATQAHGDGEADFWFVTDIDSDKVDEIRDDAHVNIAYYRDRTKEWVSVSGIARVTQDRGKIGELYSPDWRIWFGDEGGEKTGGPDDPRMALIEVEAHSIAYMKSDTPQPVVLFQMAKGLVTGERPEFGKQRFMSERELRGGMHGPRA